MPADTITRDGREMTVEAAYPAPGGTWIIEWRHGTASGIFDVPPGGTVALVPAGRWASHASGPDWRGGDR